MIEYLSLLRERIVVHKATTSKNRKEKQIVGKLAATQGDIFISEAHMKNTIDVLGKVGVNDRVKRSDRHTTGSDPGFPYGGIKPWETAHPVLSISVKNPYN